MELDNLISIKNAHKSYGLTKILKGIDFYIKKNQTLIILGDNGAGKSTLIKCISGITKFDKFDEFKILNQDAPKKYNLKVARKFGIESVFQESSIANNQSLYRNIFAGRHILKYGLIDAKEEIKITNEILKNFMRFSGVGVDAKSLAKNLSGGEKQGLAIARAIHFKSKILILDEPTTALGVNESKRLFEFLEILKKEGISIIIITHDLKFAYEFGDEFLLLRDGIFKKRFDKSSLNSLNSLYEELN